MLARGKENFRVEFEDGGSLEDVGFWTMDTHPQDFGELPGANTCRWRNRGQGSHSLV